MAILSAYSTRKDLQQQGVPGFDSFCQGEVWKRTRCRDFPCQTWKLISSVMLLMPLLNKSSFEIPFFFRHFYLLWWSACWNHPKEKRRALSFLHCFVYGSQCIVVPQKEDSVLAHLQSSMWIYTSRLQCACWMMMASLCLLSCFSFSHSWNWPDLHTRKMH